MSLARHRRLHHPPRMLLPTLLVLTSTACATAPPACRRETQAKILEWKAADITHRRERDECRIDLGKADETLDFVLTGTAAPGSIGARIMADEVEDQAEDAEEGPGFWTGLAVGGGVGVVLGVVAVLLATSGG
jgi:hypothetical protein